ncbi:hypothetical protein D5E80_24340 [Vibrio parahaemolyticus]|nr:hypothetical protein CA164_23055 [Vibrio parahaemolyticus]TBT23887.1 hypothetical protein D5E80_24340 [Vibrio parahaemolyticus]TOA70572.1 hypothetical protein CGK22_18170 [Vibrio parahaemolyticus]
MVKVSIVKEHKLKELAGAIARSYIRRCNSDGTDDPIPTSQEAYSIEVLLSFSYVSDCLDQLYLSIDMLSGFVASKQKNGLNRHDYLVYSIENYYLRLTSVYDRCLRLVNTVFRFGLPEKQCSNATIVENEYIKGTGVAVALKELDKFSTSFRQYRNQAAHQKPYSDENLDKLGRFFYIRELDDEFEYLDRFYKGEADNFVKAKKTEFKSQLCELEKKVLKLMDSLQGVYMEKSV